jgi:hypothetical protein
MARGSNVSEGPAASVFRVEEKAERENEIHTTWSKDRNTGWDSSGGVVPQIPLNSETRWEGEKNNV